jgi:hypothetical protein
MWFLILPISPGSHGLLRLCAATAIGEADWVQSWMCTGPQVVQSPGLLGVSDNWSPQVARQPELLRVVKSPRLFRSVKDFMFLKGPKLLESVVVFFPPPTRGLRLLERLEPQAPGVIRLLACWGC